MRRLVTTACVLTAALLVVPQGAEAQVDTAARDGFFIGFGLGGGSFGCSDCGSRESGFAGHLKLGGTVSPQLLLGAESSAWTKEEGGARLTHGLLELLFCQATAVPLLAQVSQRRVQLLASFAHRRTLCVAQAELGERAVHRTVRPHAPARAATVATAAEARLGSVLTHDANDADQLAPIQHRRSVGKELHDRGHSRCQDAP